MPDSVPRHGPPRCGPINNNQLINYSTQPTAFNSQPTHLSTLLLLHYSLVKKRLRRSIAPDPDGSVAGAAQALSYVVYAYLLEYAICSSPVL